VKKTLNPVLNVLIPDLVLQNVTSVQMVSLMMVSTLIANHVNLNSHIVSNVTLMNVKFVISTEVVKTVHVSLDILKSINPILKSVSIVLTDVSPVLVLSITVLLVPTLMKDPTIHGVIVQLVFMMITLKIHSVIIVISDVPPVKISLINVKPVNHSEKMLQDVLVFLNTSN
jgi:hypothetical protein